MWVWKHYTACFYTACVWHQIEKCYLSNEKNVNAATLLLFNLIQNKLISTIISVVNSLISTVAIVDVISRMSCQNVAKLNVSLLNRQMPTHKSICTGL